MTSSGQMAQGKPCAFFDTKCFAFAQYQSNSTLCISNLPQSCGIQEKSSSNDFCCQCSQQILDQDDSGVHLKLVLESALLYHGGTDTSDGCR